jgi:hypothetical protein
MTSAGKVEIDSVSGRDAETGRWVSVAREVVGLGSREKMSPVVEERLCFTAALVGSYEAAAAVARKWGCPVGDDSTIHSHVVKAGGRAGGLARARVDRALDVSTRAEVVAEAAAEAPRGPFSLVVMMDGWMARERGPDWGLKPPEKQGDRVCWHEVKTGVVFRLESRAESQSGRRMLIEKYCEAWQGDPHEFGRRLYAQALRRGLHQAQRVYVVADGAAWIWNLVEDRFREATGVLDFYHASQHLWAVAHELYPADEGQARRWVAPLVDRLKRGESDRTLQHLQRSYRQRAAREAPGLQALARLCNYLQSHGERLDYPAVERQGCPRGSGAVESVCGQLQGRFKRTGQFWSSAGKTALLELELARRNGDWDEIWDLDNVA